MKTQHTTAAAINILGSIMIALFLIFWGSSDAQAQKKSKIDEGALTVAEPTEGFCTFQYDGVMSGIEFPANVSKQQLEDDELNRKMREYATPLPKNSNRFSLEDINNNILEEVMETIGSDKALVHLIKEDDSLAHLIKEDTLMANLMNENYDGPNRG